MTLTFDEGNDGFVGKTMHIDGVLDDLIPGTPRCLNEKEFDTMARLEEALHIDFVYAGSIQHPCFLLFLS